MRASSKTFVARRRPARPTRRPPTALSGGAFRPVRPVVLAPLALLAPLTFLALGPGSLAGQTPPPPGASPEPVQGAHPASSLAPLGWLAGCWAGTLSSGALYEEWWMPEAGGRMQGMARMTREGRTLVTESLALAPEDGVPVYTAHPSGAPLPTRFPLARQAEGRWVFENPDHDFPQRIIYGNPDAGAPPFARIEGGTGAEARALEFPLARVPCPG